MNSNFAAAFGIVIRDKYDISKIIEIVGLQHKITKPMYATFSSMHSWIENVMPKYESRMLFDLFYKIDSTWVDNPKYLSIDNLKDWVTRYGTDHYIPAQIIEHMLHINDEEQLSIYVFKSIRSWKLPALFELLLDACKYNDGKMIDLMLESDGEQFYRQQAADFFLYDRESKYMNGILNCDRCDKIISLLPHANDPRLRPSDGINSNLIEAIVKNNYKMVALYIPDTSGYSRASRVLEHILRNKISISDDMFDYLIILMHSMFTPNDYRVFMHLGKHIDFGKYQNIVNEANWENIKRLGLLPRSTVFAEALKKEGHVIYKYIKDECVAPYYAAQNNVEMLMRIHDLIDMPKLYPILILCAYISGSRDTFSYVFWTRHEYDRYVSFLTCINRLNDMMVIVPREITVKILKLSVCEFWSSIVN